MKPVFSKAASFYIVILSTFKIFAADPSMDCNASFTYAAINLTYDFTNTSLGGGTYYWDFGDGYGTSSLINPEYTYEEPGEYIICLTMYCSDGDTSTTCATVSISSPISENILVNNFTVYPNPVSDLINISINSLTNTEGIIYISDILGKNILTIHSGKIVSGENNFLADITSLSRGIYFLIADLNVAGIISEKIIISE